MGIAIWHTWLSVHSCSHSSIWMKYLGMNVLFYSLQLIHSVLHRNGTKLLIYLRHGKSFLPTTVAFWKEFTFVYFCVLLCVVFLTMTHLAISWVRVLLEHSSVHQTLVTWVKARYLFYSVRAEFIIFYPLFSSNNPSTTFVFVNNSYLFCLFGHATLYSLTWRDILKTLLLSLPLPEHQGSLQC